MGDLQFYDDAFSSCKKKITFELVLSSEESLNMRANGSIGTRGIREMSLKLQNGDHELVVCRPLQRIDSSFVTYLWRTRCNFKLNLS